MQNKVDKIISEKISPLLRSHNGDINLLRIENEDTIVIEFLGQCRGCISADETLEHIIKDTLKKEIPNIKEVKVEDRVNEELLYIAKEYFKNKC